MVVKNDGENGGADELWVENEIGFGWILPMLGCAIGALVVSLFLSSIFLGWKSIVGKIQV